MANIVKVMANIVKAMAAGFAVVALAAGCGFLWLAYELSRSMPH